MYKILIDGVVADVISSNPNWVTYSSRNDMFLLTTKNPAKGVVSSDGSTVFLFSEIAPTTKLGYTVAECVEITEEEYNELQSLLTGEASEFTEEEVVNPRVPVAILQSEVEHIKQLIADLTELVLPLEGV